MKITITKEKEVQSSLNIELEQKLKELGAISIGFVNLETLEGGPEGANLKYLLPSAESAVVWAIPLQQDLIRPFLGKTHPNARGDHEKDNIEKNIRSTEMSVIIAEFLEEKGYEAAMVIANNKYREEEPNWMVNLPPEISLRYLAARSGVASFGWSGNVGIKEYGCTIILGATITNAKLEPTAPIPAEESFCNECKICTKVCAFQMFSPDEKIEVTLGGHKFSYSKRLDKFRCMLTCGGFNGLHKSGKFSTFSPGRYEYPENKKEVRKLFPAALNGWRKRPFIKDNSTGYIPASFTKGENPTEGTKREMLKKTVNQFLGESESPEIGDKKNRIQLTCGNCNIVCAGNPKETAKNYKILVNSGCVIQREDGSIEVYPPEKAKEELEKMPLERQSWYTKDYKKRR